MIKIFNRLWENFKEYIVLIVLIIISLITLSLNNKPAVKRVKALAFGSFAAFTSVISNVINTANIRSENESLRRLNARLMMKISELRKYGIENAELKSLLALKDTTKFPLIAASVVSKSLSKSQSTITLNAGSKKGVLPGMPVINDYGLVGIVNSTSQDFSIVRTLKNIELSITVKDERSRVDGIMKWNGSNLVIINVPKTYDVEPGDRIITSGLSSIIAVPLPVGVVTGISKVETGMFNEVKVKPFVNFITTEHVFVLALVESKEIDGHQLNFYKR